MTKTRTATGSNAVVAADSAIPQSKIADSNALETALGSWRVKQFHLSSIATQGRKVK
jgi:hypothetical protein